MNVTFKIKESFFDRPKVIAALKKAKRKVLSKAGAFVRRRARSSLKKPGKRKAGMASAPGRPPSNHTSGHSLKTILFAFDTASSSMVVGPVQFNSLNPTVSSVQTTAPGLHERGELATIREYRYIPLAANSDSGKWFPAKKTGKYKPRPGFSLEERRRRVKYPKRPFMQPALEAEAPKFPELFKNSIASVR
jgi:hypothetical protein